MKKISDQVIQQLRADRIDLDLSIPELAAKYQLARGTAAAYVRDLPLKRKRAGRKRVEPQPEAAVRPCLSKTDLGEMGRILATARLSLAGFEVFIPVKQSTPTDLLVETRMGFKKIQCKVAFYDGKNKVWKAQITSLKPVSPGKRVRKRYAAGEVDFFLVYCYADDGLYVLDAKKFTCRTVTLWVNRQPQGRCQRENIDTSTLKNAFNLIGDSLSDVPVV